MPTLIKDGHTPLNVTQEANHRIYVGLSWDPNEGINLIQEAREMMGGKKAHHDLDLSCYLFDADKNLIESVTVQMEKASDKSSAVYHSGDNEAGYGDGDDEQISAELKNLPQTVHHLVFTASIKSGHVFREVESPLIHLSDGYSNHQFLSAALDKTRGKDMSGYLFAHIYRSDGGWMLHNIDEFFDAKVAGDAEALIKSHLSAE